MPVTDEGPTVDVPNGRSKRTVPNVRLSLRLVRTLDVWDSLAAAWASDEIDAGTLREWLPRPAQLIHIAQHEWMYG